MVSYEDPDAFLPAVVGFPFTVSEVVSFSVPKLDASTRIRLTVGKVETQQEAQRLLDGWLAGADRVVIHPSFRLVQPHREKMLEQRMEGSGSVDLDFEQPIYGFSVSGHVVLKRHYR